MAILEVTVGPPQITINRGNTFVLSERDGSVTAYTDQGFYCRDTRYVSNYKFYADGEHWVLQNSGAIAYYAFRAYLFNPRIRTEYGEIERSKLSLVFTRAVSDGMRSMARGARAHVRGERQGVASAPAQVPHRTPMPELSRRRAGKLERIGDVAHQRE